MKQRICPAPRGGSASGFLSFSLTKSLLLKGAPWAAPFLAVSFAWAQEVPPADPVTTPPPAPAAQGSAVEIPTDPAPAPAETAPAPANPAPVPAGPGDLIAPPGAPLPQTPGPGEPGLLPDLPPEGMLPFSTTAAEVEKRRAIPYQEPGKGEVNSRIGQALDEVSPRRITLMDAVQIALLNDPIIRLADQELAIAEASRQIAAGLFDARLVTGISYEHRNAELSEAEVAQNKEQFQRNRELIRTVRQERKKLNKEIEQLKIGETPISSTNEGQLEQDLQAASLDLLRQLGLAQGLDLSTLDDVTERIAKQGIETRKEVLKSLDSTEKTAIEQNQQFPVISKRRTDTLLYDAAIVKQFRNGLVLRPYLEYDNSQNNVSRRGGQRRINRSEAGLELTIPLGRGRGTLAASGQELAAQIDVEASQLSLQHTVAERVLAVVTAYWNMAAAQEQLAYLVRSEITSSALSALTDALIKADEVPRAGASLPRARFAQAVGQRYQGENILQAAQQNLALVMGVGEEGIIYAPLAADPLPSVVPEATVRTLSVKDLAYSAFERRADYRASRKSIESGKLLAEQARLNIKPRVDLNLAAFYTGRDEEGSPESVYHLYTENHAGPGVAISLRMDWPFFQNEAKGTYKLREADLQSRLEQMRLIDNGIVSGISRSWFELRLSARELGRQQEAVGLFEQALGTERERFRLGTATMIDAIQTEERLTEARRQLVSTRLQNALALARLRFETGTLMPHDEAGRSRIVRTNFVTLPTFHPAPVDDAIAPRSGLKDAKARLFGETDPHRVLQKLYQKEAGNGTVDPAKAAVERAAATPTTVPLRSAK